MSRELALLLLAGLLAMLSQHIYKRGEAVNDIYKETDYMVGYMLCAILAVLFTGIVVISVVSSLPSAFHPAPTKAVTK